MFGVGRIPFGDVYALHELWVSLGFRDVVRTALRSSRREFDAESLVRAMVFNRLCEPDSKLGCLAWLETVAIPGMPEKVDHDQLLGGEVGLRARTDFKAASMAAFTRETAKLAGDHPREGFARGRKAPRASPSPHQASELRTRWLRGMHVGGLTAWVVGVHYVSAQKVALDFFIKPF